MIETGVYFGNIHSFYDLNLVLSSVTIAPATPKTNYVEVAGGDEPIDLTEVFGKVNYKPRDHAFTFTVHPSDRMTFDEKCSQVSNALNGKRRKITLDRDPAYYWLGRCTVSQYQQDRRLKQITVSVKVNPYKLKQHETIVSVDLTAEEQTVNLSNGRKAVVPVITCTDDNTVIVFNGDTFNLSAGTHKVLDVCLQEGSNAVTVSGTGTVTFSYQEGDL